MQSKNNEKHLYNCTPSFLTYFNKFDYFPTKPKKIDIKELNKSPFRHYVSAFKKLGFINVHKDSDPNYIIARGTRRGEDFSCFFYGDLSTRPRHAVIIDIIFYLILLVAFFVYNGFTGIFSITSFIIISLVLIVLGILYSINSYKNSYRDNIIRNDITIPNIIEFCKEDYMKKDEIKNELYIFYKYHLLKPIKLSKY